MKDNEKYFLVTFEPATPEQRNNHGEASTKYIIWFESHGNLSVPKKVRTVSEWHPVRACTVHHVTQPCELNKWHAKQDVITHCMVQNSNKNGRGQWRKRGEGWVPDTYRPPCASAVDNKQFRKRYLPQTLCRLSHCTFFLCHRSCNQLK